MEFPYKAIGFDWAHTLVDLGEEDDCRPLKKVFAYLQEKNIPLPDFDICLKKSRELFKAMIALSRTTDREARYEEVLEYLLLYFKIPWQGQASFHEMIEAYFTEVYRERQVFPEVVSVLKQLSQWGVPMGIVSNTTNPVSMKTFELEGSGLKEYFDFCLYSSGLPFRKPHPTIFQLAISRFQFQPSEILFVGDNLCADIFGAHRVGMKTAWINRNQSEAPDDISPDHELSSLGDLLDIHAVTA
jgi:putative hydrolase of the HAD superfamily